MAAAQCTTSHTSQRQASSWSDSHTHALPRFLFSISVTPTHFPPRHATHPPTPPHPTSILTGGRHPLWVAGTWARLLVTHLQAPFSFSLLCLLLRRCKPKHHHVSRQRWHQRKHTGKVSTASPYKPPSHPPAPPSPHPTHGPPCTSCRYPPLPRTCPPPHPSPTDPNPPPLSQMHLPLPNAQVFVCARVHLGGGGTRQLGAGRPDLSGRAGGSSLDPPFSMSQVLSPVSASLSSSHFHPCMAGSGWSTLLLPGKRILLPLIGGGDL